MAASWTAVGIDRVNSIGSLRVVELTCTAGASGTYTATGDAFDVGAAAGLSRVDVVLFEGVASLPGGSGTTGADAVYDYTNKKIKLYGGAASGALQAELTAATAINSFQVKCLVFGV